MFNDCGWEVGKMPRCGVVVVLNVKGAANSVHAPGTSLACGYVVVGTWLAGAGCGEAQREYGSMVCTVGSI